MDRLFKTFSRFGIRQRSFGGFGLILAGVIGLTLFMRTEIGSIDEATQTLLGAASADAAVGRMRVSLGNADLAIERYTRTRTLSELEQAKAAIAEVATTVAKIEQRFPNVPAIVSTRAELDQEIAAYQKEFALLATAVGGTRQSIDKLIGAVATIGLAETGVQTAIVNLPDGVRATQGLRLAGQVQTILATTSAYILGGRPVDEVDARQALEMAYGALADAQGEAEPLGGRLPAMLKGLRVRLDADKTALGTAVTALNDSIAVQAALATASKSVNAVSGKIGTALAEARTQQGRQTADTVARTMTWLLISGSSVLVAGMALAWLIGTSVSWPIQRMTQRMKSLAGGALDERIPGQGWHDEIGQMAEAVEVFKQGAITSQLMTAERAVLEIRTAEEKRAAMQSLADGFEANVGRIVQIVADASSELETTAKSMTGTAGQTTSQAATVATAAQEAGMGVNTVAAAAEELAASIGEIARQVTESARMSAETAEEARRTDEIVKTLSEGAGRIGDIVALIKGIADQTNLLALNATIEAARAGDAGKGFAVVASEVKNLASQTARATGEIGAQIGQVQASVGEAVTAIRGIVERVERISVISTAIAAAVEEQGVATTEISSNVQQTARSTQEVTANIVGVSQAANDTGQSATRLLAAAGELSQQAEHLSNEVTGFIKDVRAS